MAMSDEGRRRLGRGILATILAGLLLYGFYHLVRRNLNVEGPVSLQIINLNDAPWSVREAAAAMTNARLAYVMEDAGKTYLLVSAGHGTPVHMQTAKQYSKPDRIEVTLRQNREAQKIQVAILRAPMLDPKLIHFKLDGTAYPTLQNPHRLRLVPLDDGEPMALAAAQIHGEMATVSGFARLQSGRYAIQVFSTGKGRQLGIATNLYAAASSPDWGSFQAQLPVSLNPGETEAILVVYDEDSGVKQVTAVRVR